MGGLRLDTMRVDDFAVRALLIIEMLGSSAACPHTLSSFEPPSGDRHQVDLEQGLLHVSRIKNGVASTHPLRGPAIRALRRLRREYALSPYVFTTERGGAMTDSAVRKIIDRAGVDAELGFPVHPHMLRHACGFKTRQRGARYPRDPALSRPSEY